MVNILDHFGITESDLLGEGGESRVYKLDSNRILRIIKAKSPSQPESIKKMKEFYDLLKPSQDILVPQINEIGMLKDTCYSIEDLIEGENLTTHLKKTNSSDLPRILESYIEAAANIHKTNHNLGEYFGEVLIDNPIRERNWPNFLIKRVEKALQKTLHQLNNDAEEFETLLKRWKLLVQKRLANVENNLVHGDFFPGNVIVNPNGITRAVIDFSPLTVLGDWRMDVVGACIFLEVVDSYQEIQTQISRKIISEKFGKEIDDELFNIYRIYYSIYFSVVKELGDDKLYDWCLKNLKESKLQH